MRRRGRARLPRHRGLPRAAHWTQWTYTAGLNPTSPAVGLLRQLGAKHGWIAEASSYCGQALDAPDFAADAHTLREAFVFLANESDLGRAEQVARRLRDVLDEAPMFRSDPDDSGYGLSPLTSAPLAHSRWRSLFVDDCSPPTSTVCNAISKVTAAG